MSKISTFIDTLRTQLTTTFTSRIELVNPDSIEDNPRPQKESGVGFTITSTGEGSIDWLKNTNPAYTVNIFLTQLLAKIESDVDAYYANMKALFEDELTLRKLMLSPSQLGIPDSINKITYAGTSGVEKIDEKNKYKYLNVAFTVDISEEI